MRSRPASSHVVAFLDIGTNSVRLLLVRVNPNQTYTVLSRQREAVRLGEHEFRQQRLQPEAIRRAVLVCRRFADMARRQRAREIVAVATSATREARNQREFLRRLRRSARLQVRVITGPEEARLIHLGVASGFHLEGKQALFLDIGGGSTELILGDQQQYRQLESLKLGAIRLSSLFLEGETAPIKPARYERIKEYVRHSAVRPLQRLRGRRVDLAIGSSGTIENLAEIAAQRFLGRPFQRDDTLRLAHLRQVTRWLCSLPLEERRQVPGINPERADIILGGAAILEALMEELELDEIHVSERGLREGLLVEYLARAGHAPLWKGASVRARSVLHLGRICGFDEAHARTTAFRALELFDSARRIGLHRFGEWERELLECAAVLHDIGAFLSYQNHHHHTYYLIRNADLLGFDQGEIALIAAIARFHRKSLPRKKHPEFAALEPPHRLIVRRLSALLRLAESLDRSHAGIVRRVWFQRQGRGTLLLRLRAARRCDLERWGLENQRKAFEKTFRRRLLIR